MGKIKSAVHRDMCGIASEMVRRRHAGLKLLEEAGRIEGLLAGKKWVPLARFGELNDRKLYIIRLVSKKWGDGQTSLARYFKHSAQFDAEYGDLDFTVQFPGDRLEIWA